MRPMVGWTTRSAEHAQGDRTETRSKRIGALCHARVIAVSSRRETPSRWDDYGESAGWPRHGIDRVEESRDSNGQGAGESQVGAT